MGRAVREEVEEGREPGRDIGHELGRPCGGHATCCSRTTFLAHLCLEPPESCRRRAPTRAPLPMRSTVLAGRYTKLCPCLFPGCLSLLRPGPNVSSAPPHATHARMEPHRARSTSTRVHIELIRCASVARTGSSTTRTVSCGGRCGCCAARKGCTIGAECGKSGPAQAGDLSRVLASNGRIIPHFSRPPLP